MKTAHLLVATSITILSFAISLTALAGLSGVPQGDVKLSDATPMLELPRPIVDGDISYLTGGIGDAEAESMRFMAKEYPLEIVLIQKFQDREEFLASVNVKIEDHHHKLLLDIATEGPYLLARLPKGHYQIIAEHDSVIKQQWVTIEDAPNAKSKHQKIVFWWPANN